MKKNSILNKKVQDTLFPIGNSLDSGGSEDVNIVTSMKIENGEDIIGYQYLHGTNKNAGGFTISGTISKNIKGDITYDLTYTWNDIIDPNYKYASDGKKAEFAKKFLLQALRIII